MCLQLAQRQLQRLLGPVGVAQKRCLPLLSFDMAHIPEKTGHHHDEQHQPRHVRQAQKAPGQPVGRNADVRQGGAPGCCQAAGLGGRGVRVVVGRHGQVVIRVMLCCSKKRPVDGVRPRHTAIFHGIARLRRILRCGAGYRSLKFGLLSIPPYLESGDPCFRSGERPACLKLQRTPPTPSNHPTPIRSRPGSGSMLWTRSFSVRAANAPTT